MGFLLALWNRRRGGGGMAVCAFVLLGCLMGPESAQGATLSVGARQTLVPFDETDEDLLEIGLEVNLGLTDLVNIGLLDNVANIITVAPELLADPTKVLEILLDPQKDLLNLGLLKLNLSTSAAAALAKGTSLTNANPQFGTNTGVKLGGLTVSVKSLTGLIDYEILDVPGATIGIGGGNGGLGGGGGGGLSATDIEALVTAGKGDSINGGAVNGEFLGGTGSQLEILDSVLSGLGLNLELFGGGGGGITRGGAGFAPLDLEEITAPFLGLGGGGGGSLGLSAADLGYVAGAPGTGGVNTKNSYTVSGGMLSILGGSGAGGGVSLDLATIDRTLLDPVLKLLGLTTDGLLTAQDGAEIAVSTINQTGGTVNIVGGTGGGGGLVALSLAGLTTSDLTSSGGDGGGVIVDSANLSGAGSVLNVYGGAGGGANALLTLSSAGGYGGGGRILSGSMAAGTVLNIYSGADGGDMNSGLLGLDLLNIALLDDKGVGGEGYGGMVGGGTVAFTLNGGEMNLYAGTSHESMQVAEYNLSGEDGRFYDVNDASTATAHNIVNKGATVTLYGGRLTGTYDQEGGTLVLVSEGKDKDVELGDGIFTIGTYTASTTDPNHVGTFTAGGGTGLFTGGSIMAGASDVTLSGVTFGGTEKGINSSYGTGGVTLETNDMNRLTVTGSTSTAGSLLFVQDRNTLQDHTNNGGTVQLDTGSGLAGAYVQTNGQLTLNGGDTDNAFSISINGTNSTGAKIISTTTGALIAGVTNVNPATFLISGKVVTDAIGTNALGNNSLTLQGATISAAPTGQAATDLTIGTNVELKDSVLTGGTVNVTTSGKITGTYNQSGGVLNLAATTVTVAPGTSQITGGTINSSLGDSRIENFDFTAGTINTGVTGGGTRLTLSEVNVTGTTNLNVGNKVVLESTTLADANSTITMQSGSSIKGSYTQTDGTLSLSGQTLTGGDTTDTINFSGGTVTSVGGASTLDNANFTTGLTTTLASQNNTLAINNANVSDGGRLEISEYVTLKNTTLSDDSSSITVDKLGRVGGTYLQTGGTLNLNGTVNYDTNFSISSGVVNILNAGTGMCLTAATGGDAFTQGVFTLSGDAQFNLAQGAVIKGNTGTINLNGGTVYAGADINQDGVKDNDSDLTVARLTGNTINVGGSVSMSADANTSLVIGGDNVDGDLNGAAGNVYINAGGNLTLGQNVTLDGATVTDATGSVTLAAGGKVVGSYVQKDGSLVLSGGTLGDASKATNLDLQGGTVRSTQSGTDKNTPGTTLGSGTNVTVNVTGDVTAQADLRYGLQLDNVVISNDSTLTVGKNTMLNDGQLTAGNTIRLATETGAEQGGMLIGDYVQNGGNLVLSGGRTDLADSLTFNGGSISSEMANGVISGADFTNKVTTSATGDNKLTITDANITTGAGGTTGSLDIGTNVTLNGTTNLGAGEIKLSAGGAIDGDYTQTGAGALILAGGTVADTADINLAGGSVKTENVAGGLDFGADENTADITGDVTLTAGVGKLTLTNVDIDETTDNTANIKVGKNTVLDSANLVDGSITLANGGSLAGHYTQGQEGTLILDDGYAFGAGAVLEISGGTLQSNTNATVDGAIFLGVDGNSITLKTDGQTGSSLLLVNTVIDGGNSVVELNIGSGVTMRDSIYANTITTISGTGTIEGRYTQRGDKAQLILAGGDTSKITEAIFQGGSITVNEDATLKNVYFENNIGIDANAKLTLNTVVVRGNESLGTTGEVDIGTNITANDVTMEDGKITLSTGGTIGKSYTQDGGSLVLNGGDFAAGADLAFNGGTVDVTSGGTETLDGATFGKGSTQVELGASNGSLDVTNAVLNDGADVAVGGGAMLDLGGNNTLAAGRRVEMDGGTLGGGSFILGGGTLVISTVDDIFATGTTGSFRTGDIIGGIAGATLDGGVFEGGEVKFSVDTEADANASLTLSNSTINSGAKLNIGSAVTLDGATLNTGAEVVLGGGMLDNSFTLAGGTLTLGEGSSSGSTSGAVLDLVSGTVKSITAGGALADANYKGTVNFIAEGSGAALTIVGGTLDAAANLVLGGGATLTQLVQDTGKVTLQGGALGDGYELNGSTATLILDTAAETLASGAKLVNGTLESSVKGGNLVGATIDGAITTKVTDLTTDTLNLVKTTITAGNSLTVGSGVTLTDTASNLGNVLLNTGGAIAGGFAQGGAGILTLAGGAVTKGTDFSGGTITTDGQNRTLTGVVISGLVDLLGTATGTLTLTETTIASTGDVIVDANSILKDATLGGGKITLDGGALTGNYTQSAGSLTLKSGSTEDLTSAVFSGGSIIGDAGAGQTMQLADAVIKAGTEVITSTVSGALDLLDVTVDGGSLSLGSGVGLTGDYIQQSGNLTLNGGTTAGADSITLNSGSVTVGTSSGATLDKAVINDTIDWITDTGDLALNNATLNKGTLTLDGGLSLTGVYTQNGGTLDIAVAGAVDALDKMILADGGVNAKVDTVIKDIEIVKSADGKGSVTLTTTGDATLDIATATLTDGKLTISGNTDITGKYVQNGGELTLNVNAFDQIKDMANNLLLNAGSMYIDLVDGEGPIILDGVKINSGFSITAADDSQLVYKNIDLGPGDISLGGSVGDEEDPLDIDPGTDLTLTGGGDDYIGSLDGSVTQKGSGDTDIGSLNKGGSFNQQGTGTGTIHNMNGGDVAMTEADTNGDGKGDGVWGGIVINNYTGGSYSQTGGTLDVHDDMGALYDEDGKRLNPDDTFTASGGEIGNSNLDPKVTLDGWNITGGKQVTVTDGVKIVDWSVNDGSELILRGDSELDSIAINTASKMTLVGSRLMEVCTITLNNGQIGFSADTRNGLAYIENLVGTGTLIYNENSIANNNHFIVDKADGNFAIDIGNLRGLTAGQELTLLVDLNAGDGSATYKVVRDGMTESGSTLLRGTLTEKVMRLEDYLASINVSPSPDSAVLKAALAGESPAVVEAKNKEEVIAHLEGHLAYDPETKVTAQVITTQRIALTSSAEAAGNAAAVGLSQANVGMFELGRHFRTLREANQSWKNDNCLDPTAFDIWAQTYTHHTTVESMGRATMNVWGLDIGIDRQFDGFAGGSFFLGAVAGGQWLSKFNVEQGYGRDGDGDGKAFSLGVYGTWMNSDGWYASLAARNFWSSLDMNAYDLSDTAVDYDPSRTALAFSAEVGKRFALSEVFYVEPSVGLMTTFLSSDEFMTSKGERVSYGATKALEATAAVALGYSAERFSPYVEAALIQGVNGKTEVNYAGDRFHTDPSGTRVRAALGASYYLNSNVSLSFEAAYEHGSDFKDINGNFGVNFSW